MKGNLRGRLEVAANFFTLFLLRNGVYLLCRLNQGRPSCFDQQVWWKGHYVSLGLAQD